MAKNGVLGGNFQFFPIYLSATPRAPGLGAFGSLRAPLTDLGALGSRRVFAFCIDFAVTFSLIFFFFIFHEAKCQVQRLF